jgi:hypothetical protein
VGAECVDRRGSVVTGWERKQGRGEDGVRKWMRRCRKSIWGETRDCSTGKGGKVNR